MLVRIAHDPSDAGQRGDLLGSALGVAASDHDLSVGIFAVYPADRGARILVGGGGHGTGIEHDYVGFAHRSCVPQASGGKSAFHGGAISLGRSATKVL